MHQLTTNHERPATCDQRRIVIGIPCLLVGGTEMQTLMVVKALRERERTSNIERRTSNVERRAGTTVVCYFEHDAGMVEEFGKAGAEVVLLDLDRSISAVALIRKLRTVFSGLKPDIVHIQYMAPGLLPIIAARLAGIRNVLATVHQPATPYGRLPRLFLRIGTMLCRRFVCVSEAAERSWFGVSRREWPRKTQEGAKRESDGRMSKHITIHNAVDIDAIDAILARTDREQLGRELGLNGALVIGTVARLSPEKGIDLLLKTFASVHPTIPTTRLLIVGDGAEQASLKQLARDLGLEDRVVWAGRQPWEKAIRHLSLMDVVAIPSRYEGFGLTAIEAMACSKPVVAFDLDSISEVIGNSIPGASVPLGDVDALAAAIADFLMSTERRESAGLAGRERIEAKFGFELFTERWHAVYESVD